MTEEIPYDDKEEYGFPDSYEENLDSIEDYREPPVFYNTENLIEEVLEE